MEKQQRKITLPVYNPPCSPVSSAESEDSTNFDIETTDDRKDALKLSDKDQSVEQFGLISESAFPNEYRKPIKERKNQIKRPQDERQLIPWETIIESNRKLTMVICNTCLQFVELNDMIQHQEQHSDACNTPLTISNPSPPLNANSDLNILSGVEGNLPKSNQASSLGLNPFAQSWNPYTKARNWAFKNHSYPRCSILTRTPTQFSDHATNMANYPPKESSNLSMYNNRPLKSQTQNFDRIPGQYQNKNSNFRIYREKNIQTRSPESLLALSASDSCPDHSGHDVDNSSGSHAHSAGHSNRHQRSKSNRGWDYNLQSSSPSCLSSPSLPTNKIPSHSLKEAGTHKELSRDSKSPMRQFRYFHTAVKLQSLSEGSQHQTVTSNKHVLQSTPKIQNNTGMEEQKKQKFQEAAILRDFVNRNINSLKKSTSTSEADAEQPHGPTFENQTTLPTTDHSGGQLSRNPLVQGSSFANPTPIPVCFQCAYCQLFFSSYYALIQYEMDRQGQVTGQRLGSYYCKYCFQSFQYAQGFGQHELDRQICMASQPPGVFNCKLCLQKFGSVDGLSNHEKADHNVFRPQESRYCYVFACERNSKWALTSHNPNHNHN